MTLPLAARAVTCKNLPSVSLEHTLVDQARAGDGRAFAALVEPHLAMLYRIAARACRDSALAEDAVQEALTLAFRRLDRYQPGTSLRAFLATMAVKQAQTMLRSERRRRVREDASAAPERPPGPADLVAAQRTAQRVREVIASLPKKRQQAALLRLDAGMSYGEIAQAIGTSEGSARVLVHYALNTLREQLRDVLEESDDLVPGD
jgi:RNA polymerase sigma-70 factor (ECF subfamily)